jgi:hypothetical protein
MEFQDIKIIRYEESIYYANADNFKYKIKKLSGFDPIELYKKEQKRQSRNNKLGALSRVGFG